jgi:hypothetical protein
MKQMTIEKPRIVSTVELPFFLNVWDAHQAKSCEVAGGVQVETESGRTEGRTDLERGSWIMTGLGFLMFIFLTHPTRAVSPAWLAHFHA